MGESGGKSSSDVTGTSTTAGLMAGAVLRAMTKDVAALLAKPDVGVFLQSIVELSSANGALLADLHDRVKGASRRLEEGSSDGEDVDVGTVDRPLPLRLYESLAWSFTTAAKVVLQRSSSFGEIIAACDAKLAESEARAAAAATGGRRVAEAATAVTVSGVLGAYIDGSGDGGSDLVLLSYRRCAEALVAATPEAHPDRAGTLKFSESVFKALEKVTDTLEERSNYDKLVAIKMCVVLDSHYLTGGGSSNRKIMDTLISRQRKFIREGTLKKARKKFGCCYSLFNSTGACTFSFALPAPPLHFYCTFSAFFYLRTLLCQISPGNYHHGGGGSRFVVATASSPSISGC